MEDTSKCCDKSDDRKNSYTSNRSHFTKRQDSWMEFKGRLFRMASTVVLPKNKRVCSRSLAAESARLKTPSMSVKSLPQQIQRDEAYQKPKFYTRSISVQDESRLHREPTLPPDMKSKRVLFAPQELCIDELEEVDSLEKSPSASSGSAFHTLFPYSHDADATMNMKKSQKEMKMMSVIQPRRGTFGSPAVTPDDDKLPMHLLRRDFPPSGSSSKKFVAEQDKSMFLEEDLSSYPDEAEDMANDKEEVDFSLTLAYHDFYSCMPPPIFMLCITIAEVGFFVYHSKQLIDKYGRINKFSPAPLDSVLIYDPTRRYEVWRYLTYALVHSGYMHIINNIAIQLVLGILLEMVHKWWRVLAIYFAGILAGSLATSIAEPFNFLAGASAGVYALIAAHLSTVILNWSEMERPWIRILIFFTFVLHDCGHAIYFAYVVGEKTNVGYAAHLGGAVAGLLVGIHVLKNLEWKEWEKVLWWFCIVVCALLLFFAVGWNIIRTDLFP